MDIQVENLRCEYTIEPLGIDVPRPRLSWGLVSSRRGQMQTAYQILVTSDPERLSEEQADLWDSGKVLSGQQAHVEYGGKALCSGQRAHWRVRVWNGEGEPSPWSEDSWWEMGLTRAEEWSAQWIGAPWEKDEGTHPPHPAPHFRKGFHLRDRPQRARAYVSGLGWFELHVNGTRVSEDALVPSQTDYDQRNPAGMIYAYEDLGRKRVVYLTYDIAPLLQSGENVIGVILGNGWYNQRARTVEGQLWYGAPRLRLQAHVTMPDGKELVVPSDDSWRVTTGPIVYDQVFGGEVYDARLRRDGWDRPGHDDSDWAKAQGMRSPTGLLSAQVGPPDRVMRTLRPVAIVRKAPGAYEVDFGQNFAGWVRMHVCGPKGQEITCRFSQHHNENPVLTYILKGGGEETYEPRFTWFAFRKIDIEGWPGELTPDHIEGRVVYTAVDTVGDFACSKPLFNEIHRIYLWSQMSNMHGAVPSDCPHRERLGYTGDGQVACETAIHLFDMARFYTKWIQDMADAQNPRNGYVPHTVPYEGGGGGPGWGSAFVIIPWQMYRYYGDRRLLEEHYEGMKRWVECLASWSKDGIVKMQRERAWNLGDWVVPGGTLPEDLVHTFYYGYCAKLLAQIARVLGRSDDAQVFAALHESVCRAFHAKYFRPDVGCYHEGRHGADVFALALDAPPKEIRDRVAGSLVRNITERHQGHLDTGILATALLPDVLSEIGRDDLMFTILSQTTPPSYGHWIAQGHTTTLECWDGSGSDNHPMFGSAIRWLYTGLVGLQAHLGDPGYGQFVVRPRPVGDVTWARYRVRTLRGHVAVEWRREQDAFTLRVEVPANSQATVHVPTTRPDGVTEGGRPAGTSEGVICLHDSETGHAAYGLVGSGRYEFRAPIG